MSEQEKTAKSTAERQAALRQRRADEGLIEVRNVYANPERHTEFNMYSKTLQKKKVLGVKSS